MFKKISIVFLFIIMLISIGSVCATDSADITVDDANLTTYNENINDIVNLGTEKSFKDIQDLIGPIVTENKEVNLSGTYYGNKSINIKINSSATLTINGQDNTVLNAQDLTRIFVVDETPGTLILNNLKLINGNTNDNSGGAAIYSEGATIILNNCTFYNHIAKKDIGGAIYATNTDLTVNNCIFQNSTALGGGAISVIDNGYLNIKNSLFKDNTATDDTSHDEYYSGGAILTKVPTNVLDSTFVNNKAPLVMGGAISVGLGNTDLFVSNSTFYNNSANWGGAIYASNLNIKDSYFELNHIDAIPEEGIEYSGAAISYMFGGNYLIENTSFISNYVDASKINDSMITGGAIFGTIINLNNCYFEGNYIISITEGDGGAVFSEDTLNVKDSTFVNNRCPNEGGAISVNNLFNVYSSTFINNTAGKGGAISSLTELHVDNSSFINNKAKFGGAINIESDYMLYHKVGVKNSIFVANSANKGDAIYLNNLEKSSKTPKFNFDNCYWGHNYLTKNSFIKAGVVTYKNNNIAPNNWILMNLTKIGNENNIDLYKLSLNTKTNGKKAIKSNSYLPDYTVDLVSVLGNEVIPSQVTIKNGIAYFALIKTQEGKDIIKVYDPDSSKLLLSSNNLPNYDNNTNNTNNTKKPTNNNSNMENTGNPLVAIILTLAVLPILRRKL